MSRKSPNAGETEYIRNRFLLTLESRRLGYKYYEIVVSLRNVVGALSTVTRRISESKMNILAGMTTEVEGRGYWVSFIEVPEAVSVEKALEEISSLEVVTDLKYHQMDRAENFDKFLFPLALFGRRMMVLTDYMFNSLKSALIDLLESGGETILYMQGQTLGEDMINVLKDTFKEELESIENTLHFVEDAARALGWGIIKFQEINPEAKTGSVVIRESIEYSESSKIKCHFLRGFLTGTLRRIFDNEDIRIVEVKCRSEGAPYCEFQFV